MLFIVNQDPATAPIPQNKVAIVSLAIGAPFFLAWRRLCQKSWEDYARKCGFDIILIIDPIDNSDEARERSPAWQKLLILSQPWSKAYDRIIWMDADIIISPAAQNVVSAVPDETKVGISVACDRMSASEKHIYIERTHKLEIPSHLDERVWVLDNQLVFKKYGIESKSGLMFNTGVMVVSPRHHEALFQETYEQKAIGTLYEQPYLSHLLEARGLAHKISPRYNWGVLEMLALYMPEHLFKAEDAFNENDRQMLEYLVYREFHNSYFLHFYGCMGIMRIMMHSALFGQETQ